MLGRSEGNRGRGEEGGDKGYLLSEGEKVSPLSTEEGRGKDMPGGKTETEADSSLGLRRRRRAARLDISREIAAGWSCRWTELGSRADQERSVRLGQARVTTAS